MIRRLSKNNDLVDNIISYPLEILDSIYKIEYYIIGHEDTVITPDFSKKGDVLQAVIPTSLLATLDSGILYRKCYYKVEDDRYPDGYYNLELVDDLNIWLGEETLDPVTPFLVADDLKTLNGQSLVGEGDIEIEVPTNLSELTNDTNFVSSSWVNGTISQILKDGKYATESDIPTKVSQLSNDAGYLTEYQPLKTINGESLVGIGDITIEGGGVSLAQVDAEIDSKITGYATEEWVENKGYLTSHQSIKTINGQSLVGTGDITIEGGGVSLEEVDSEIAAKITGYAKESWVEAKGYLTSSSLSGYALKTDIPSLTGYAKESWVTSQGYVTSSDLSGYAKTSAIPTKVSELTNDSNYITKSSLSGYATQSWVEAKGYLTSSSLSGYALKSYVTTQLANYATETWVENKNYLTSSSLSTYAKKTDIPTVPTNVSELTNDSGYLTSSSLTGYAKTSDIPTKTSQLTNDSSYITLATMENKLANYAKTSDIPTVPTNVSEFTNDAGYIKNGDTTSTIKIGRLEVSEYLQVPTLIIDDSYAATQSYVATQLQDYLLKSSVWSGSSDDWDALTDDQKSSYTIALITE